jgi:signal transduction histidine kinase
MFKGRLRTKFLFSLLLIITALTCATLLIVRNRVRLRVRNEIFDALRNSVGTFQTFRHQRELNLARSAALVASLPNLKALMTTQHEPTIQDASTEFWQRIGSDLFVLTDRGGKVMALHTATAGFTPGEAQALLGPSLQRGEPRDWWFGGGHLYEVFLQPIYFGSPADNTLLGVLAVGYEVDDRLAEDVRRIASSQVAFLYARSIVVSTLPPFQQSELGRQTDLLSERAALGPQDIQLGDERFLSTSVELAPGRATPVSLSVLKSYDEATVFLERLNRMLLGLGLAAVLVGSALVFLISDTFTRPLASLVAGVRALETGDFAYPLTPRGADEVSELTAAFDRMRHSLQKTQQELLDAERLATIGRMASSISHDLRHPLTAFLAYSEFLSEGNLSEQQRKDLYQEIRLAVNRMTDLISSLLEFSKARRELRLTVGSVEETLQRAIQTVRARPEFRSVAVTLSHQGETEACFDARKLERVFHNLLLNACEAVPPDSGRIELSTVRTEDRLEIRVADNGSGIPEAVRETVFEPFVSYGKPNGTGLGLAVVHTIMQDHGGEVRVESTGHGGTVFKLALPVKLPPEKTLVR